MSDLDTETGSTASRGRHPVSIGHLVMGLVFACFLVLWAVVQFTDISSHDLRFLWPVPWIARAAERPDRFPKKPLPTRPRLFAWGNRFLSQTSLYPRFRKRLPLPK